MRISLLFLFLLLSPVLFSQRAIEVSYTQDSKGNLSFSCANHAFCTYIVSVEFTTFQNAKADHALPYVEEVKPGVNKLFTVSPEKPGDDIQVKYKTSFRKGCFDPRIDTGFTYLMPVAPGKETQVYEINKMPGEKGRDSGFAVRFRMKQGDTIYAARRGVVTVVYTGASENDAGATATDSWNYVEIVHGDCTFGQYGVFKKDGAFVHPGQTVEAGTPLGLVGGDKFGRGSDARLSVSYYNDNGHNIQLPLLFWTRKNGKGRLKHGATYTSEYPKAILTQELPKTKQPAKKGPVKKKG
jgi:murein DD-endopeptidase MepM/ murein hydrolase activator NlpD